MERALTRTNVTLTKALHQAIHSNPTLRTIPFYAGLVPYEWYVLPGMYIALLQMIWTSDITVIRFHILPHLLAYSFFQAMKSVIPRVRPGCAHKSLSGEIERGHCTGKVKKQSFPSGHTGIAFALAAALFMELRTDSPRLFGVPVSAHVKTPIATLGFAVATLVAVHRVVGGYHYVGDVVVGAILGVLLGTLSWNSLSACDEKSQVLLPLVAQISLSIPISFLLIRFLLIDVRKLTSIKH